MLKFSKKWNFFYSFCKIDGIEILSHKIDGFHGTHRIHANGFPVMDGAFCCGLGKDPFIDKVVLTAKK